MSSIGAAYVESVHTNTCLRGRGRDIPSLSRKLRLPLKENCSVPLSGRPWCVAETPRFVSRRFPGCRLRGALLLAFGWLLLSTTGLFAHDALSATTQGRIAGDRLLLRTKILAETAWSLAEDVGGYSAFQPTEFDSLRPAWERAAKNFFYVDSGGQRRNPDAATAELDGDYLLLETSHPLGPPAVLQIEAGFLKNLAPESHASVVVFDEAGAQIGAKILQNDAIVLEIPRGPGSGKGNGSPIAPPQPSFGEYLRLGVHHILSGYDHLLFLGALLVGCRRLGSMLAIVTCFTVGHSITLALAALGQVTIPPSVIEPLIAATIVYVAVENLLRREEPRGRWALTFGFGLVHGFGFAGVLRDTGLSASESGIVGPLFAFNAGVELGQLAVIAVFLPLLLLLRRRSVAFARFGAPVISAAIGLAGLYWLAQRTLFS
jgi:hypothetical protein